MQAKQSRRRLLKASSAVLFLPAARTALAFAANERINFAVFGNRYNAAHFLTAAHTHNATINAICNPDQREIPKVIKAWQDQSDKLWAAGRAEAAEQYARLAAKKDVAVYADVRKMFAEMAEKIDAVVVSDFEHFHGVVCGAAMRLKKPICNERPLGLTIDDARRLRAMAKESGVPTVYRSPGTQSPHTRRAIELVHEGALGDVKEVHVWFKRTGADRDQAPQGPKPVPAGLDWDLWLGPLAWREFHPDWLAYSYWRETSCGGLGVFGPHTMIFPFLALRLRELWDQADAAIKVTAECARVNTISYPKWERVVWEIPARGAMKATTITWHLGPEYGPGTRELIHGRLREHGVSDAKQADAMMGEAGSLIVCEKGAFFGDDHSSKITALPAEKIGRIHQENPRELPVSRGLYNDWVDEIRGKKSNTLAHFDHGGPLSELLMLGNIATLYSKTALTYEPAKGRFAGRDEANQKLAQKYREGWSI
jgi:hypothetical protein